MIAGKPLVDSAAIRPIRQISTDSLDFTLPPQLEASEPPEARGLERDEVRLMVSYRDTDEVVHARFRDLPEYLNEGDVLVVNTSGTLNASIPAESPEGIRFELHLSAHLPGDIWTVELRVPTARATEPLTDSEPPKELILPGSGIARIHDRYYCGCFGPDEPDRTRLWMATFELPTPLQEYLAQHGRPIRYGYVKNEWPNAYYQTLFAKEIGSAEMPSAGRAFTPGVLSRLGERGVIMAPLLLHTGVASVEDHEPPYEEFYRISPGTANRVNRARSQGKRIIAVGTTAVRALETVADASGEVHSSEGWTCTVITPQRGVRVINGLLTGLHEPRSTHLAMLEAISGRPHLERTYREALDRGYLWHEFGDLHLII